MCPAAVGGGASGKKPKLSRFGAARGALGRAGARIQRFKLFQNLYTPCTAISLWLLPYCTAGVTALTNVGSLEVS